MKLKMIFIGIDIKLINKVVERIKMNMLRMNIMVIGPVYLPKKRIILNILKSPHVNKDARDQIGFIYYRVIMILIGINKERIERIMENNIESGIKVNGKFFRE